MATVHTLHQGNIAIQTEVWTLTLEEGASILKELDLHKGGYWDNHFGHPYRVAKRNKTPKFHVYTGGFSSGEFSNILAIREIEVSEEV
jgi:hypothetical protein